MIEKCFFDLKNDWVSPLKREVEKSYFRLLKEYLNKQLEKGKSFYPIPNEIFAAFAATPLSQVKVVILGQDPYHGEGQAHGLSFSVKRDVPIPPSLKNIYKELKSDLGIVPPSHGCLSAWAKEGVLLLNSTLTVAPGVPESHKNLGWSMFTDSAIDILNHQDRPLVFILWGSHAQKKGDKIDHTKHLVISSPHPSPLSAYRGFFGSKPFSKSNSFLISKKIAPINWSI
jgi:uracil-DNA glycosylase